MLRAFVPFKRLFQQPLTFLAPPTALLLSFSMTTMAACERWPQATIFAGGTALTYECCKVALFSKGIQAWHCALAWPTRLWGATAIALAAMFAVGSVGASVLCMSQSETASQHHALASSRQYTSAVAEVQTLEAQITALTRSMEQDIGSKFRARGLRTAEQLQILRENHQAAERKLATIEQEPPSPAMASLATWGGHANMMPSLDLLIEIAIGAAIELASFLFLCEKAPQVSHRPLLDGPPSPTTPVGRQRRSRLVTDVAGTAASVAHPNQASCVRTAPSPATTKAPAIPATYARRLRYDFGPRTQTMLDKLVGNPRHAACRDLLQRMGEHCLRVGGTNGTITTATIRADLRDGRDWRTVQTYLRLLTAAGVLTTSDDTYTIVHFLDANPTTARRTERLADMRSKVCNRQSKHRIHLQNLQAAPLQNVDLSGLSPSRHAHKPQTTEQAVPAAHAATHQPTAVQYAASVDVGPALRPTGPRRQRGSVVAEPPETAQDHQAWLRQIARIAAGEIPGAQKALEEKPSSTPISRAEAAAAADEFERSLEASPKAPHALAPQIGNPQPGAQLCIPVRIPDDPTPVNHHSVTKACAELGLSGVGNQVEDLFVTLSREAVREAELRYATTCTAIRRAKGLLRRPENPAAYLLAIIRRQRAMAAMGSA